jgi:hypothetical protein
MSFRWKYLTEGKSKGEIKEEKRRKFKEMMQGKIDVEIVI